MKADFSWEQTVCEYLRAYESAQSFQETFEAILGKRVAGAGEARRAG
jgi:hypothetical protein